MSNQIKNDKVENFLKHYGVKGMKWGVYKKEDEEDEDDQKKLLSSQKDLQASKNRAKDWVESFFGKGTSGTKSTIKVGGTKKAPSGTYSTHKKEHSRTSTRDSSGGRTDARTYTKNGKVKVEKTTYDSSGKRTGKNTTSVKSTRATIKPLKGGREQVTLADGSKYIRDSQRGQTR